MSTDEYLAALDQKLQEIEGFVTSISMQRQIDTNLGIGFIKGQISFVNGSRLEFSEQLPTERKKFRLQYMDAESNLLARWDSAPHYKDLKTFPFHKHTPQGIEEHLPITLLEVLDEIAKKIRL